MAKKYSNYRFFPETKLYNDNSNGVNYNYYNPSDIFNNESEMTGPANFDLLQSFITARQNGLSDEYSDKLNTYLENASAIQINVPGQEPIIDNALSKPININYNTPENIGSYTYPTDKKKELNINNSYPTLLGHSEKRVIEKALNKLFKKVYPTIDKEGIYAPSDPKNLKSRNLRDQELETFDILNKEAENYKNFLQENDHIVKLWTERPPCPSGIGNCKNFLSRILPQGSHVGYITKFPDIAEFIAEKEKEGKNEYLLTKLKDSANKDGVLNSLYYPTVNEKTVHQAYKEFRNAYNNQNNNNLANNQGNNLTYTTQTGVSNNNRTSSQDYFGSVGDDIFSNIHVPSPNRSSIVQEFDSNQNIDDFMPRNFRPNTPPFYNTTSNPLNSFMLPPVAEPINTPPNEVLTSNPVIAPQNLITRKPFTVPARPQSIPVFDNRNIRVNPTKRNPRRSTRYQGNYGKDGNGSRVNSKNTYSYPVKFVRGPWPNGRGYY